MRRISFSIGCVIIAAAVLFASTRPAAAGPDIFTYDGSVLDAVGAPLADGVYLVDIQIFDVPAGGVSQFAANFPSVSVTSGFFSVEVSGFGTLFETNDNLWLEVGVDLDQPSDGIQADEIYTPRQRITSAPFAANADALGGAARTQFLELGRQTIDTVGPNAGVNTRIGANPGNLNFGEITVFDDAGGGRAFIGLQGDSGGAVNLRSADGNIKATLGTPGNGGSLILRGPSGGDNVTAATAGDWGEITLRGETGNVQATLNSEADTGSLRLFGPDAGEKVTINTEGDWGDLALRGPNGNFNIEATTIGLDNDFGAFGVNDNEGDRQVDLFVDTDDSGVAQIFGPNGQPNVSLGSFTTSPDRGLVQVYDEAGNPQGEMLVGSVGAGLFELFGANGSSNILMTTVANRPSNGAIVVGDSTGTARAGIFVNTAGQGEIFADMKSFIVDHPTRPGFRINYTSLEGPEVGIYHRGRVRLSGGRGVIDLPEHFSALAVRGSVTVQLTPASLDSLGVGIASVSTRRVEIGELGGGRGEYAVHFIVHARRRGHDSYQTVVSDEEFNARFSPAKASRGSAPRRSSSGAK